MRRREFIAGSVVTAAIGFARPVHGQSATRSPGVKRIAVFALSEPVERVMSHAIPQAKAYFDGLKKRGYIEGSNLIVERYSAKGQPDSIGAFAREIVASHPDVILPFSGPFIKEVMALNTDIPMVGPTADPVTYGFATSLARPDRNFTGVVADAGLEIWAKRVQLLLETARKVTKVGFLVASPTYAPVPHGYGANVLEAAQQAGVATVLVNVAGKFDRAAYERVYGTVIVGGEMVDRAAYERSFELMEKEGVDGIVASDPGEFWSDRQLIADLAAKFRIPAIYAFREFVEVGGLMAYGIDNVDLMRRVGEMTGQVLGGTKPSDIPFYRQTKFELLLNQKAATSLGLEFPPTLLTAADEVIE